MVPSSPRDAEVVTRRARGDDDALDHLTDGLGRLRRVVGMSERGGQPLDPAPIGFGNTGVDVGNVQRRLRQPGIR